MNLQHELRSPWQLLTQPGVDPDHCFNRDLCGGALDGKIESEISHVRAIRLPGEPVDTAAYGRDGSRLPALTLLLTLPSRDATVGGEEAINHGPCFLDR